MSRILVVEDNPRFRQAADKYFSGKGVNVVYAFDLRSAESFPRNASKGVIIDCFFPYQTGSDDLTKGQEAIEKMLRYLVPGREGPITKILLQARELEGAKGIKAARLFTKKVGPDYDRYADLYEKIEDAMQQDPSKQPLGILFAEKAEELGMPFVLATSRYHYDNPGQPIQDYTGRRGWTLVDCNPGDPGKDTAEFWEKAYDALKGKMTGD